MCNEHEVDPGFLPTNDWLSSKWRPAMGWMYMGVCIFDFVLFPIAWSAMQASLKLPITQWDPITLRGAGLFHIAMGAILGVAAWSRGQEKITAMNQGYGGTPPTGFPQQNTGYPQQPYNSGFQQPSMPQQNTGGYGTGFQQPSMPQQNTGGYGTGFQQPSAPAPVAVSSTGKAMPISQGDPSL